MSILNTRSTEGQHWDLAGIGASGLCVLHCLATPLIVVVVPAAEIFERQTHATFALAILALGLLAFLPGYRLHRRAWIPAAAVCGFALVSLGVVVPEGLMSASMEESATVVGGATLIVAHLRNAFFCRACPVCCEDDGALR